MEVALGHRDARIAEAVLWVVVPMVHAVNRDFEPPRVASRSELAGVVEVAVVVEVPVVVLTAWVLLEVVR